LYTGEQTGRDPFETIPSTRPQQPGRDPFGTIPSTRPQQL
jgi:hypothetical protein